MALAQAAALLELGKPALQRAAQGNVELVNGLFDSELRMAVIAALAPDGTLRECPGASDRAAVSRLVVEVAERLASLEARGTLRGCNLADATCAASVASSCAMLANVLGLGRSKALRVAAAAALPLGSGRRALQWLSTLTDAQLVQPQRFFLAADQLDSCQMIMQMIVNRGIAAEAAAGAAPLEQLLGWLRDAARLLSRLWPLERKGGSLTSLLTSYSSVVLNVCQAEAPYASIQAALAEPGLAQPLLMGLAEAPAALRGESSPLHAVEAWQLLGFAGSMVRGLAGLGGTDACNRLLSSSAAPGGPVLMELVRDAVAAMPRSLPPGVPLPSYRMALAALCGTFALLGRSGSSGSARAAPMSDADWAAVEAFSRLWLQLASLCDAGEVMQDALLGMFRLLKGAASSCTPRRLQLAVEAAWVAARQLPLLSAAHAAHPDRGHAGRLAFCLLDPLIACAGQLAAAEPGSEAGGGASAGPEAAEDARDCLQQLHVRLCKAVHAMLVSAPAEEQQAQASLVPAKEMLAELLGKSYDALEAAFDRWERRGGGVAEGGDRTLRQRRLVHAATQWEAMRVLAAQGALRNQVPLVASQGVDIALVSLYFSFTRLAVYQPGAVRDTPWLRFVWPLLERSFQRLGESAHLLAQEDAFFAPFIESTSRLSSMFPGAMLGGNEVMREVEVDIMAYLLKLVSADGGLAAALLSHPRLPALLDHVAGTRVSDAKMGALLGQLSAAFHAMLSAAAAVGAATGEAPGGGAARAPPACLAQLSAAADGLEAAMRAAACPTPPAAGNNPFALPTWVAAHGGLLSGPGGLGMGPPPSATAPSGPPPRETFAAFRATLVPLAAQLATALLPHWPPPEVQRAERLELARAVAACRPGCSNLCCPDWREQCRRPHKCAGCMVSRFCGVACQKAAWGRGGHKSVCKLLGAPAPADE